MMNNIKICQSCSMPLENEGRLGTEKDGSKNNEYCKFCYQGGAFTHPGITLQQMMDYMMLAMKKEKLPGGVIQEAIHRLPELKRWKILPREIVK